MTGRLDLCVRLVDCFFFPFILFQFCRPKPGHPFSFAPHPHRRYPSFPSKLKSLRVTLDYKSSKYKDVDWKSRHRKHFVGFSPAACLRRHSCLLHHPKNTQTRQSAKLEALWYKYGLPSLPAHTTAAPRIIYTPLHRTTNASHYWYSRN